MEVVKNHTGFQQILLTWFERHQRDLPWRKTYLPYHVWISEVMLQQTQMERGVEYFIRWMERFPDIRSLADASEQEVLKTWEGLGYYSRARNIRAAADVLLAEHGGVVPDDYAALLALPGIGPYTAAAIMSIAFNKPYPVIDANVERLFARFCDLDRPIKEREVRSGLEEMLRKMLVHGAPREFNQALMELGALVCRPRSPLCGECPLGSQCLAFSAGTVMQRPVLPPRKETIDIIMACAIIEHQGKFFIQQRRSDDVWGGLWEFPGGRLKNGESAAQAAVRELYEETELRAINLSPFRTVIHHYTRYRVTLHAFSCNTSKVPEPRLHAATAFRWVALDELDRYPFPSGHRQLVAHMKQK